MVSMSEWRQDYVHLELPQRSVRLSAPAHMRKITLGRCYLGVNVMAQQSRLREGKAAEKAFTLTGCVV
jgi:hypothetical protein